jgi:hypothetical protein
MLPILETNYNNPSFDTSNPEWSKSVCRNMTAISKENAASANPIQEWMPVLSPGDELRGDVGVSGWALKVEFSGKNKNDFLGDVPFLHPFYNDFEFYIAPDQQYFSLLANSNRNPPQNDDGKEYQDALQRANSLAQRLGLQNFPGTLGVEIDQGLVPSGYQAQERDRVAVFGRWIVDCGHADFHTEIHPPLLMAVARPMPLGTLVKVIGRAFLVSQNFGDGPLIKHLLNQLAEKEAEATISPPTAPLLSPMEARPKIISPPFSGLHIMSFLVRPPTPRSSPDDKLLLSFHFTVRTGVAIEVTTGPNPDEVQVIVSMNDVNYKPAAAPPRQTVTVHLSDLPSEAQNVLNAAGITNPIVGPVIAKGILTDRYDLLPTQGIHDSENVVTDFVVGPGAIPGSVASSASVDDNQPYPIYGWLILQWSNHSLRGFLNAKGVHSVRALQPSGAISLRALMRL